MAVVLVLLATSRSYRNTRCFDQNYQSCKITLQVSVLSIECLLAADGVTCIIFLALIAVVAKLKIEKGRVHMLQNVSSSKRRTVDSESRNFAIKIFYRQCLKIVLVDYNTLG